MHHIPQIIFYHNENILQSSEYIDYWSILLLIDNIAYTLSSHMILYVMTLLIHKHHIVSHFFANCQIWCAVHETCEFLKQGMEQYLKNFLPYYENCFLLKRVTFSSSEIALLLSLSHKLLFEHHICDIFVTLDSLKVIVYLEMEREH